MPIVTLITRAEAAFVDADMLAPGTHVNAMGAIARSREEFAQDLFPRVSVMAADHPGTVQQLSKEFNDWVDSGMGTWESLRPLSEVVAEGRSREPGWDLTLFKSMGMGLSDLAVGGEILRRARAAGLGRPFPAIEKTPPRLRR